LTAGGTRGYSSRHASLRVSSHTCVALGGFVRPTPVAAAIAVLLCAAIDVHAIPRYTARVQQNCTLCHVNPTGGGMRSLYASQFLVPRELSLAKFTEEQAQRIRPDVSSSITLGADLRSAHFYASEDQAGRNFFQMQGDLYVAFAADEKWSANLDVDQIGSVEIFALGWVLPWQGYVKAGRFTPVFGWKLADHNMFNREELWFDQPFNTDAGVEVGFYPRHVAVWASILNGEPADNTRFDSNDDLAYVGGALWQFGAGPVSAGLGGSIWYNERDPAESAQPPGRRTAGGPFGYLTWGRATWLWEVDANRLRTRGVGVQTGLVTAHEVSWQVEPGLDVVATYNWVDRDLDRKTGSLQRFGLGVDVMPVPCVQLQAHVNVFAAERGTAVPDPTSVPEPDYWRSEVQLHLFY